MSIKCKYCGRDHDATLFEFDRSIICVCGKVVAFEHEKLTDDELFKRKSAEEKEKGDEGS